MGLLTELGVGSHAPRTAASVRLGLGPDQGPQPWRGEEAPPAAALLLLGPDWALSEAWGGLLVALRGAMVCCETHLADNMPGRRKRPAAMAAS